MKEKFISKIKNKKQSYLQIPKNFKNRGIYDENSKILLTRVKEQALANKMTSVL